MDVSMDGAISPSRSRTNGLARLRLLDGFDLRTGGQSLSLPMTVQRLLVFLALSDRPVLRSQVAGTLWLDVTEERATASLRSALWRLRRPGHALVEATQSHLRLASGVAVDYREAVGNASALLDEGRGPAVLDSDPGYLSRELLPGWSEDWVVVERERFRQLRLHALEARCSRLAGLARFAQAVQAGLAAVACEPLRESAHRLLISVHLAEGNRAEALRQYHSYCRLLREEMDLLPSAEIEALVTDLLPAAPVLSSAMHHHRPQRPWAMTNP
jgi:DNA-binding SARP family transcriptional activator